LDRNRDKSNYPDRTHTGYKFHLELNKSVPVFAFENSNVNNELGHPKWTRTRTDPEPSPGYTEMFAAKWVFSRRSPCVAGGRSRVFGTGCRYSDFQFFRERTFEWRTMNGKNRPQTDTGYTPQDHWCKLNEKYKTCLNNAFDLR
jgi:hypothetical protein